jgi:hypothetical protein
MMVIDIPRISEETSFRSSLSPSLRETIASNSDGYIASDEALAGYEGVGEIHVPHGQRHISEFTHTVLGVAVGKKMISLMQLPSVPGPGDDISSNAPLSTQ